jgi:hypothetical protein
VWPAPKISPYEVDPTHLFFFPPLTLGKPVPVKAPHTHDIQPSARRAKPRIHPPVPFDPEARINELLDTGLDIDRNVEELQETHQLLRDEGKDVSSIQGEISVLKRKRTAVDAELEEILNPRSSKRARTDG